MEKQKGFTLVEALFVLSIFMIISLVTVFSLKPQQSVVEEAAFLTQLQSDLYFAQNYAIAHQHQVLIIFLPSQYKYTISERTELPPFLVRSYSKSIYLTEGSLPLTIKFLPNGNVSDFGSILIHTKNNKYKLTFLIGRGRFYVKEQ